jgi:hypothetical protein
MQVMHNNYTGEGSHLDSANNAGMSGMEDYDSAAGYQSAIDYNQELEI